MVTSWPVAVFKLTHRFPGRLRKGGKWRVEGTVTSQRALERGRHLSLGPHSCSCLSYILRGPGIKAGSEGS